MPKIKYSMNKACHDSTSLMVHWKTLKRILHYLKISISYGLQLRPISTIHNKYNIHAYCDANWTSHVNERRPMYIFWFYFGVLVYISILYYGK